LSLTYEDSRREEVCASSSNKSSSGRKESMSK